MQQTTRRALEDLQSNFNRVAVSLRELMAIAAEAAAFEYDAVPLHLRPFRHFAQHPSTTLADFARRTCAEVVEAIRRELAGAHALELEGHERIVGTFFVDASRTLPAEGFCCVRMGQALYEAFADGAASMGLRQAADRVVDLFRLSAGTAPEQRRGYIVLDLRMHTDRWGGRLSWSNDQTLVQACQAMTDVVSAIDAGVAQQMQPDVERLRRVGQMNRWEPSRTAYGPIGPVVLRAYQNKVEFQIPLDLAARINACLTEHASSFAASTPAAA
ncbi:hypothetical protein RHOFW510R12_00535 [Rhodanobacter sp. FW510-R12]|uniref:hypothetical protein n=1 Tax=Rhodanobacter thiooxydans TaxID=416169 RepID=UPI000921D991|nr:hypothetical protein [Rhodanobacter thiooxydans]UJJ56728.1 hypothetical protein LRK53_19150 [Rhodanobacter thiooxydans]